MKRPRSRRRRVLLAILATVALWLVASWAVGYRLTRRPRPVFAEPVPQITWGAIESHRIATRDGHEIGAWYLAGRNDAPAVLLLHGNRGSRANSLGRAEILAARGCPVLMISLRAHGDSTGDYNDMGYGARLDVLAAVEFLERRHPGRPIAIQGTSMGGSAAIFASAELGGRVRGYLLESPYRDLRTAVWNRTENALPPVLESIAYGGLLAVSPLVLPHLDRISPVEAIAGIPEDVPVLILSGARDDMARPAEAEALFDRVRSHGELRSFPEGDHSDLLRNDPARLRDAMLGFLDRLAGDHHVGDP